MLSNLSIGFPLVGPVGVFNLKHPGLLRYSLLIAINSRLLEFYFRYLKALH